MIRFTWINSPLRRYHKRILLIWIPVFLFCFPESRFDYLHYFIFDISPVIINYYYYCKTLTISALIRLSRIFAIIIIPFWLPWSFYLSTTVTRNWFWQHYFPNPYRLQRWLAIPCLHPESLFCYLNNFIIFTVARNHLGYFIIPCSCPI